MYRALVARRIRKVFHRLSEGDYAAAVAGLADDVRQVFPGEHALGGERRSREGMRLWFERVYRLLPDLRFELGTVAVSGWPWRTDVAAEWTVRATPRPGQVYENAGATFFRVRWGRAVEIREYLDTELVAENLRRLAAHGVEEAAAAPIAA